MRFFSLIGFLFVVAISFAQTDLNNQPVRVEGLDAVTQPENNTTGTSGTLLKIPSVVTPNTNTNSTISLTPDRDADFMVKEEFLNPGEYYEKKLNKRPNDGKEGMKVVKGNQSLGEFKNNGKSIKIYCRDHQYVDGDIVRISVNDVVIHPNVYLNNNYKTFVLDLQPGFNKLDFQALNQGTSGPNTAELRVFDENGNPISINEWNLATGFKATIIIIKEE